MAVEDPPWALQADAHPAAVVRHAAAGIWGSPIGSFAGGVSPTTAGGGHGVCSPGSMAVSQSGTPGMSVVVAAGQCVVRGTENNNQGNYGGYNDADATLTIATADGTNPRNDLICFQVRDAAFSGAVNDARLVVVQGTPNAVPVDPSLSTTPNALVLARVRVNAGVSSITNANITDLRPKAYALGGVGVTTSALRPTGASLYAGLTIYETDTKAVMMYDGTGWKMVTTTDGSHETFIGFAPGGSVDADQSGTLADWINVGNITVPAWATKARVRFMNAGFYSVTAATGSYSARLKIGTDLGRQMAVTAITQLSERTTQTYIDEIALTSTGSKALVLQATRTAGAGTLRVDTSTDQTAEVRFFS